MEIKTEVQNSRSAAVNATLKTDIVDNIGKVVATVSSQQRSPQVTTMTFDQTTPAITSPSLWPPDHPTMYQALSSLSDGAGDVDNFTTPFGFRWFSWTGEQGFSLNGSHFWLQGANVHQDHAGWGAGVTDSAFTATCKMVKDAGLNFIRGSHYPRRRPSRTPATSSGSCFGRRTAFGAASAVRGRLFRAGTRATPPTHAAFDTNVLASLTDMIRIHRNHPSIIAWSMGNEDFFTALTATDTVALLKKAVSLTHQLDPAPTGRPAAIGGAQSAIGGTQPGPAWRCGRLQRRRHGLRRPWHAQSGDGIRRTANVTRPGSYDPGWGNLAVTNNMPAQYAWRSWSCQMVHVRLRQPGR